MNISSHLFNKKIFFNFIIKKYLHVPNCLKSAVQTKKPAVQPKKPEKKPKQAKSKASNPGENVREILFCKLQNEQFIKPRRVAIIGASGRVGSAIAYNIVIGDYCDELILYDRKEGKTKLLSEMLDFCYCRGVENAPRILRCMDFSHCNDCDLIIITAGIPRKPGQSRLDVAKSNVAMFKEMIPKLAKMSPDSVLLIVSNPADVQTYAALKFSGFSPNRVLSTGCEVDSARFRYHLSQRLGINPASIEAYMIGEHGASAVPCWDNVKVAGTALKDLDPDVGGDQDKNNWKAVSDKTLKDGGLVIGLQGWTNAAVSYCTEAVARSILSDSRNIRCVSVYAKGLHGIDFDVCLSLPCVLGNKGVISIVNQTLSCSEKTLLLKSAETLAKAIKDLNIC